MGIPALKLEPEEPVLEERFARLESDVEHIKTDVSDIKIDVRRLNDKIDAVDQKLTGKIDAVNQKLDDFRVSVEKAFAKDRVGWLLIAATLLGVMAKGFKWI
jgi:predicted  nucleic acid-binding Zn-ribbon protein